MILRTIAELLDADRSLALERLDAQVSHALTADLMSDVLAAHQSDIVLLTGLANVQVIRAAEMADVKAIVFVGNRRPTDEAAAMARKLGVPVLVTSYSLYESSGRLYSAGLEP